LALEILRHIYTGEFYDEKNGIALLLLSLGFATAYAQLLDGLPVDVNLDFTVFGMEKNTRSDVELRRHAGNFNPQMFFFPYRVI